MEDGGQGFPRIRGDRPADTVTMGGVNMFPPHTRGSACRSQPADHDSHVSPAYAGIGPMDSARRYASICFPRIRGDRPHS